MIDSLGWLWTDMGLMYPLAEHQQHCQKICVFIRWANFYFRVFVEYHYSWVSFLGRPNARSIYSIFSLFMESRAMDKSTKKSLVSRFFARSPSIIRRIIKICDVVDQFLWKPFWFFQRFFSISNSIPLSSRTLYILAGSKCYTSVVLGNSNVNFLLEKKDSTLCQSLYRVLVIYGVTLSEQ